MCRYKYSNGNMYEGKFDEGQRSGLGRFIWARTSEKYEGEWKHDERHGYGVHVWHDGTKYQGQFRLNKMEGNGQYIWPDGRVRSSLRPLVVVFFSLIMSCFPAPLF